MILTALLFIVFVLVPLGLIVAVAVKTFLHYWRDPKPIQQSLFERKRAAWWELDE